MGYFSRHRLITLTLLIQLIALPLLLILTREPQNTQGKAAMSTEISLTPQTDINNPQNLQKDEYFAPSVVIEPGPNLITEAKLEIFYDPTKVELVKSLPISINTAVFPNIIAKPTFSQGKIELSVSVVNSAKPITDKTKVATIFFKTIDSAQRSYIYFGKNTKLFGLPDANLNLLQDSIPLVVSISTPSAKAQSGAFNANLNK